VLTSVVMAHVSPAHAQDEPEARAPSPEAQAASDALADFSDRVAPILGMNPRWLRERLGPTKLPAICKMIAKRAPSGQLDVQLVLAECYERAGRLASAWHHYRAIVLKVAAAGADEVGRRPR
jgi:hypothetical protein